MKIAKRLKPIKEKIDPNARFNLKDGMKLVLESAATKFDESVDVAIRLGVDPKQGDQQVRGAIALPHGLGKTVRVLVFAKGPKEKEALDAGADHVGADDIVEKIKGGWLEFDKAIATPDMMVTVSKVAKILGPRGLMPNPKVGTVAMNVGDAVTAEKKGKLDFRIDKAGIVHAPVGRRSMGEQKIKDNFLALLGAVVKAKPASSKGVYLQTITMSATMGPGIRLDVNQVQNELV
jgi:large subunit ribosomal protein L1